MADNVLSDGPSDSSLTSTGSQKPIISSEKNPYLVAFVVVISLIFIWGIALLPAIFYANILPAPAESKVNTSLLPPPVKPCNHPLVWNPKHGMCEPPCPWVSFPGTEDFVLKVVDNFSISISLLGFVIVLATWIRIKQLRAFPHIIPLYIQGLSAAISFLLALANGMGREKAFCSSKFFAEAHEHPTTFCTVQGILIHYCSGALALWFLVYSINLVQVVYSDSLVSLQGNKYKIAHVVCSLICWLMPCIPVGIVLGLKTASYQVMQMRLCFPVGSDTEFFTTTFISEVSLGVGCTCLLVVVYKLFMLRDVSTATGKQAESRKKRMNKVVKRVVFLMCAYAAITALTYAPICALQQHSKLLEYYIKQYFGCLMFQPPEQCPRTYKKYTFTATFIVSYLCSAMFALTTVCFLAFNKQSRRLWNFWWNRIKKCCV